MIFPELLQRGRLPAALHRKEPVLSRGGSAKGGIGLPGCSYPEAVALVFILQIPASYSQQIRREPLRQPALGGFVAAAPGFQ